MVNHVWTPRSECKLCSLLLVWPFQQTELEHTHTHTHTHTHLYVCVRVSSHRYLQFQFYTTGFSTEWTYFSFNI